MIHSRFKLFPTAIAAALAVASCTNEEAQVIPPTGNEIQFATRVSRATETTLDVLKNSDGFKVYADVDDWNNLLINGEVAKYDTNAKAFVLGKKYNWTSDMKNIQFWAYHPIDPTIVKPHISASDIHIDKFTPVASLDNPGKTQSDLIIAYNKVAFGTAPGNAVPLTFQHALSQVSVNVNNAEVSTDGRKVVKIAGACIVNVKNNGSLYFHAHTEESTAAADNRFTINDPNYVYDIEWKLNEATNASYGLTFPGNTAISLTPGQSNIAIGNNSTNSSLMLVPQTTTKYDFENPSAAGSYILLLCRVEIHHPGETHTGTREGADESVGSDGNGGHIHQLFPALQDNTYDPTAYGYTCVPVGFDWKPGLRHIYTLNFLGSNAGAGQYPPEDHPEFTTDVTVVPTPDDKEPGDNVLDNPITFTVDVAGWKNATEDPTPTPMP